MKMRMNSREIGTFNYEGRDSNPAVKESRPCQAYWVQGRFSGQEQHNQQLRGIIEDELITRSHHVGGIFCLSW